MCTLKANYPIFTGPVTKFTYTHWNPVWSKKAIWLFAVPLGGFPPDVSAEQAGHTEESEAAPDAKAAKIGSYPRG